MSTSHEGAGALPGMVPRLAASAVPDSALDAATDAYIAADAAGIIVAWNHQAEWAFGWARPEALGRQLVDTVVSPSSRSGPQASIEWLATAATGPLAGRRIEFEAVDRTGQTFPVEVTLWATSDSGSRIVHLIARDVSSQHRDLENLYRMAALVYSLDEAIVGVDLDGFITSWNAGAERTFGYRAVEVVGKPLPVLLADDCTARSAEWWSALLDKGEPQRHEVGGMRRNGVAIDLALTISPICDGRGRVSGASVVARDVTQQRWMARTLETTLESLETALKETRESEACCRRFLADAAHQLRTPIAGIRASAETVLRGTSPGDRDQLLLNVVRETSRASRVMTGLLAMARVDAGEALTLRPCDLVGLCIDEVERFRTLAPELEIDVREVAPLTCPPEVDANAVREILSNLLDNARRHAQRMVEVLVSEGDDTVEVRVVDDGAGLPDEMAERVFERFVTDDGRGGSGLGLPIARGLAQAHGGDLTYLSRADGFVVRLPRRAPKVHCGGAGRPGPPPAV